MSRVITAGGAEGAEERKQTACIWCKKATLFNEFKQKHDEMFDKPKIYVLTQHRFTNETTFEGNIASSRNEAYLSF